MEITVPALEALKMRASDCLWVVDHYRCYLRDPDRYREAIGPDADHEVLYREYWPRFFDRLPRAGESTPDEPELLRFVSTLSDDGRFSLGEYLAGTAHAWCLMAGKTLAGDGAEAAIHKDGRVVFCGSLPNDAGGTFPVRIAFDGDDFGVDLNEIRSALDREYKAAARYVLDRGGCVEFGPQGGTPSSKPKLPQDEDDARIVRKLLKKHGPEDKRKGLTKSIREELQKAGEDPRKPGFKSRETNLRQAFYRAKKL